MDATLISDITSPLHPSLTWSMEVKLFVWDAVMNSYN